LGAGDSIARHVRLGTNLKVDTTRGGFGVVNSLGASLDIGAHTVIITGSEGGTIAQAVDGNSIVGSAEADGTGITSEASLGDVI